MIKARIRWFTCRVENILTLGKLLSLWLCFLLHSILFLISQTSYRTYKIISSYELSRPVMGTIFLVNLAIMWLDQSDHGVNIPTPAHGNTAKVNRLFSKRVWLAWDYTWVIPTQWVGYLGCKYFDPPQNGLLLLICFCSVRGTKSLKSRYSVV